MNQKVIHPTIEDLHFTIKNRKNDMTAVIMIYDEIHSFTTKSNRGRKAMDLYGYGLAGVYNKHITIEELTEDIECVRDILNNRSVG